MALRHRFPHLTAALALAGIASAALFAQAPTFKSGTEIVSLFVTVADSQGRLVPDLAKADFEIYDNDTRLWDAVMTSLEELNGVEGRRVVLVFTDGDDTESRARLGNVVDKARVDDAMIYAIGLQSVYFNGQRMVKSDPDSGLKKI